MNQLISMMPIASINYNALVSGMLSASVKTIEIFFLTLLFAIPLGMLLSFGRMSKHKLINLPCQLYLWVMRGTPLMLQLMFVFFAPAYIMIAMGKAPNLPENYRFIATIIAFSLNYAAYFAEIFRSGMESIPVGQHEAADMLGYTRVQKFFLIILPQVVKRVLPAVSNETITLVKDTALAQTIAVAELFTYAKNQTSAYTSIEPLLVAAVFYLVMNGVVTLVFGFLEKKLNYYK